MKNKRVISPHSYHRGAYIEALKLRQTKRLTGSEIARKLGLPRETVCSWLRVKRREGVAVHVQAPYVAAYQKAIRLWHKEKLSAYSIAKKLGLPDSLVRTWLRKEEKHEHSKQAVRGIAADKKDTHA